MTGRAHCQCQVAFFYFQYRVRDVSQSLIPKYTSHDIRIAAGEVAQFFPALAECDAEILKFLSKKIKTYIKSQRKKINKSKESKENAPHSLSPELPSDGNQAVDKDPENEQVDQMDSVETVSPRKRALSRSDPYDFDEDIPAIKTVKRSVAKSKKPKPQAVPTSRQAENAAIAEASGKEYSGIGDIKFEIGHFVVLGKDIDEYDFCKVDSVEYHKLSGKYHMSITYFELIDGRLEVLTKGEYHLILLSLTSDILGL